jgi:hypothetical protein
MDDKKLTDRHDVIGDVKIDLRLLWEQKWVVKWYYQYIYRLRTLQPRMSDDRHAEVSSMFPT